MFGTARTICSANRWPPTINLPPWHRNAGCQLIKKQMPAVFSSHHDLQPFLFISSGGKKNIYIKLPPTNANSWHVINAGLSLNRFIKFKPPCRQHPSGVEELRPQFQCWSLNIPGLKADLTVWAYSPCWKVFLQGLFDLQSTMLISAKVCQPFPKVWYF